VARGAVAAGARGLIRGGEREDLVVSVAKGLMLLLRGARARAQSQPAVPAEAAAVSPNDPSSANGLKTSGLSSGPRSAEDPQARVRPNEEGPAVPLPLQRHEAEEAEEAQGTDGADGPEGAGRGESWGGAGAAAEEAVPLEVGLGAQGTATVEGVRRLALTERELQVLRGMADGKSNAEIGRELFVSEDTVKTHARRLFRKLGARDRAHAVAAAFRAGLVR
jgi:DNA-binding CsgD family transcriptional regulator